MTEPGGTARAGSWLSLLSTAVLGALAWMWMDSGHAASLHVSPIRIEMSPTQSAASVTLTNVGSTPVGLRIRTYVWSQVEGRDALEETAGLAVSPATATVAPGASQTFRVSRPGATAIGNELSYRLIIEELPRPVEERVAQGVTMVLRISIPLFVADESSAAELSWRLGRDERGPYVDVVNSGGRHARLRELTLWPEGGEPLALGEGSSGYVLAGSRMRFDFPADGAYAPDLAPGELVTLTARSHDLEIRETLRVEAP